MPVATGRDRGIDAVRTVATMGVVGGHWLVTGLIVDDGGAWRQASPLTAMPALAPVTWLLQTLGLFFFAGGFAAARSLASRAATAAGSARDAAPRGAIRPRHQVGRTSRPGRRRPGHGRGRWWGRRAAGGGPGRLLRWVAGLLAFWSVALTVAAAAGAPAATLRTVAVLVVSPLWFLLPYLLLRAGTGPLIRLVDRARLAPALAGVAIVAAADAGVLPGWCAVPAAWSVPWVLGIAAARGRPPAGLPLLLAGGAGMALLIGVAGYPVSAVGVPGDGRSNLAPPSLFAVALAAAQIGVVLTLRGRRFRPGRRVPSLDRAALPVYLWHQSVLIVTVAAASALAGTSVPGLLTAPAGPSWIAHRAAWLPLLALVLVVVVRPRWWTRRRARAH